MAHRVTFIPGDGTGPEIAEATKRVLDATGVDFEWDVQEAGVDIMETAGTPLPDSVIESIKANKVAIKGPITTPVGTASAASTSRCARRSTSTPAYALQELQGRALAVRGHRPRHRPREHRGPLRRHRVREGHARGAPARPRRSRELDPSARQINEHTGISIKPISVEGTRRIVKYAFDYAVENGRKKVTAVHKANIMKYTDGLWLAVATEVAKEYPDIEFEERIVDNMCMQLVQKPELYDVLVLPNLYGDILSDLGAGLVGGLGVAPGANIGTHAALFEPTHGSAPKYAGQNKVNPIAMMLSGVMMLRHLKETEAADRLEDAIAELIREGKSVTYDMKADRNDPTAVGTSRRRRRPRREAPG